MMDCKWLLLLTVIIGTCSAQKLFFKSNKIIQQEIKRYEQEKTYPRKGFGFKEPIKYFTGHRKNPETAPKLQGEVVVCPGNKSACPAGSTCCMTSTMAYGCCPLPMAMCCLDKRHCCPARTRCDVSKQACISGVVAIPWYEKTSAISLDTTHVKEISPLKAESVLCPDGEHQCADGQTCCKSAEEYSCCPLPHVESFMHAESVICPDGEHQCADGQTCCRTIQGSYSCCPLPNAVCCSDEVHCCPTGTTCDVSHGRCNKQETGEFFAWVEKLPKQKINQQYDSPKPVPVTSALATRSVKCDEKHVCPTGNTCCKMVNDDWGCCPKPEANCCEDRLHCCPKGSNCEPKSSSCVNGLETIEWSKKQPAILVDVVKCDDRHECPTGNTCCKLVSGQWGCCPLAKAVCCSDGVHCCPDGTTCDVSSGKCNRGDVRLDWFVKQPVIEVKNVQCDSTHECPSGNTCCKLESGSWGCCPLPQAVCCSDGVHCCPDGTTCDVSSGKCMRGDVRLDWFVKQPVIEVKNVQCDSTHECPSGNTCCKLESGSWGCCPLPKAVCCSDGVHCCPDRTTCDVSSGKCNRGDVRLDWFVKQPVIEVKNVQCDSTHECPSGNTCCKLESGSWGCCPLPKAVCCSDGVHCCPDGTTCDVSSGKCNRGDIQLDWFVKQPVIEVKSVKCDSTHECPSGNTCCKLESGSWGCCPLPEAVCCSDGVHCCPDGSTCDVSSGKCIRGDVRLDWFVKQPVIEVKNVQCDSTHECPSGNTCCKLESGSWGCCPLPKAVCCSDGVHCCPDGTTCDVSSGKCNRGDIQLDWFVKQPVIEVKSVKCDSTHECPSGNTCCKLESGSWGCCPLPEAVCCSDGVHCCPDGSTCDVSSGKCIRGDVRLDWFVKQPVIEVKNVQCDSTHECPSGNTCCKLESGSWGCCPLPKAVCCSDGVHCCPDGTTCDVSSGKCNRGDIQLDWFVKQPVIEVKSVKCDSTHECPSGNTCCKLESGSWGCCPLPEAVCCSDGVHCCPDGSTCDVSSGKCIRGDVRLDWFVKQPVIEVKNVQCDSTHECPSGNTCCKLESGSWGCCPLPKAVCCSDGVHCCPDGTTCDVSSGKCNRGDIQLDWFVKQPVIEVKSVKCDSTHECPSGNTCCKLESGSWGCCPLPEAVCCSDGVHCCPDGSTCDVSSGKCNHGDVRLDWFVKQPVIEVKNVQCDSTHECPSGNTCCKLESGSWGCCPLPKAVCCSDGVHCCPDGTTCDVSSGKCNRGDIQLDWFVKQPVIQVRSVKCDSTHECPSGNTCCRLESGNWGCCPLPKAVCCSDGVHCCPDGTTCDVSSGKCNRGDIQLDWFVKQPVMEIKSVKCDSTHECPSGNTCCKLGSGSWGCCPLPKAVCCSDHVHCCPAGTTCDAGSGKCDRGDIQLDWFVKTPAAEKIQDVICPDGSECQDGQTCCQMIKRGNSYGCCPLPNAVCCSDGEHCCPYSYRCAVSAGACIKGLERLPLIRTRNKNILDLTKSDFPQQNTDKKMHIKNTNIEIHETDVKCPDGKSCPAQYSCCDNGKSGYNCCPMTDGVCCDDHQHCCPHGYICDEGPGICRIPETNTVVSNFVRKLTSRKGTPLQ